MKWSRFSPVWMWIFQTYTFIFLPIDFAFAKYLKNISKRERRIHSCRSARQPNILKDREEKDHKNVYRRSTFLFMADTFRSISHAGHNRHPQQTQTDMFQKTAKEQKAPAAPPTTYGGQRQNFTFWPYANHRRPSNGIRSGSTLGRCIGVFYGRQTINDVR